VAGESSAGVVKMRVLLTFSRKIKGEGGGKRRGASVRMWVGSVDDILLLVVNFHGVSRATHLRGEDASPDGYVVFVVLLVETWKAQ